MKTVFVVLSNDHRRHRDLDNIYHAVWLSRGAAAAEARRLAYEFMVENRVYPAGPSGPPLPGRVRETEDGEFVAEFLSSSVGWSLLRAYFVRAEEVNQSAIEELADLVRP